MEKNSNLYIPGAIVIAGLFIATGIFFSGKSNNQEVSPTTNTNKDSSLVTIKKEDHVLGNPNADISIVEYSDTECPFCKRFHSTLQSIINTYGKDGKVAWIYRHFPLDSIHKKTRKEAQATECANELGGNKAFWSVLDAIYSNTTSNDGLDLSKLPVFAKSAGLDADKFNECLSSAKYAGSVQEDFQSGLDLGIRGTPFSVMVLKKALTNDQLKSITDYSTNNGLIEYVKISDNKKQISLNGALPEEIFKAVIDIIIK